MNRVGILSGTFDPIHKGHIAFALQAADAANLDYVVLIPEPLPRRKTGITHLGHRVAMIRLALIGHPKLRLLELPDKQFTTAKSLPRLQKMLPDSELFLLLGVDILAHMAVWPLVGSLLTKCDLIVGVRGVKDKHHAQALIAKLPVQPKNYLIISTRYKNVSSKDIRLAMSNDKKHPGELSSIQKYIAQHWLYTPETRHLK